jgi:transposase
MAESVLYNWLSARRAAAMAMGAPADVTFVPIGVIANCAAGAPARLAASTEPTSLRALPDQGKGGQIEINLPSGARVCVDMSVDEKALSRVLRAVKGAT